MPKTKPKTTPVKRTKEALPTPPRKKTSISNIITNILLVFAIIVFAFTVIFAFLARDNSHDFYLFGYKPYIITSGSMSPELSTNAIALIHQVPYDEIKVGDIISYRSPSYDLPVCHRVIEITEAGMITQGDNVDIPDAEPVTSDMFRGKLVWHTNFFAGYIQFVQEKGIFIGLVLPAILILGIILAIYFIPKKPKVRKESEDATPSEN